MLAETDTATVLSFRASLGGFLPLVIGAGAGGFTPCCSDNSPSAMIDPANTRHLFQPAMIKANGIRIAAFP
jgi:hypothetical protein